MQRINEQTTLLRYLSKIQISKPSVQTGGFSILLKESQLQLASSILRFAVWFAPTTRNAIRMTVLIA